MILSLGIGNGGLETELAATVICSYLYMVTQILKRIRSRDITLCVVYWYSIQ